MTVANTGSAPLRITSILLGGPSPARFGLTKNCPIGGTGLAVGGSCTINVTFTPNNNPAIRTALVRVNVAAPAVSQTVALTGTSIVPTVSVTPASIAFGNQLINTISSPQAVTVANTGTVPVVIASIGLGTVRFVQTNNCPIGGTGSWLWARAARSMSRSGQTGGLLALRRSPLGTTMSVLCSG